MDSKVYINQTQSETRENKETIIIAGVSNKQDQKGDEVIDENQYSSL